MLGIISGKKGDEYLDEITIEGETDEADADGDGTIDQEEFREWFRDHLDQLTGSKVVFGAGGAISRVV